MKRKLLPSEEARLQWRDRLFSALYENGCKCLWEVKGPETCRRGDIAPSALRAYVIMGKVHIFHLYTNGAMDIYGEACVPKDWESLIKWVEAAQNSTVSEKTSTPLTVEPM